MILRNQAKCRIFCDGSVVDSMKGFIDIHNHILPGLDDGAQSIDQAFFMLELAVSQGISAIIATPHFKPDRHLKKRHLYEESLKNLRDAARNIYPDFRILRGNEIYFYRDVIEELKNGTCHTLANTDYVLVEFSTAEHYSYIKNAVELLSCEGYRPIIAHTERYRTLEKDMERVWELIDMGALVQVNTQAVRDGGGMLHKSFVKTLLKEEAVHFLATDAHNTENRAPVLDECERNLKRWCSASYIKQITKTNQRLLVQNRYIG